MTQGTGLGESDLFETNDVKHLQTRRVPVSRHAPITKSARSDPKTRQTIEALNGRSKRARVDCRYLLRVLLKTGAHT